MHRISVFIALLGIRVLLVLAFPMMLTSCGGDAPWDSPTDDADSNSGGGSTATSSGPRTSDDEPLPHDVILESESDARVDRAAWSCKDGAHAYNDRTDVAVRVIVWTELDDEDKPVMSNANIDDDFAQANRLFERTGIMFSVTSRHTFSDESEIETTPQAITLVYFDQLDNVCGRAYLGPDTSRPYAEVVANCARTGTTTAHELGHALGLNHPHGTSGVLEDEDDVEGLDNDCYEALPPVGDGLCDTPPDPSIEWCRTTPDCSVLCDEPFTDYDGLPDAGLVMDYYPDRCSTPRSAFTVEQANVMRCVLEEYYEGLIVEPVHCTREVCNGDDDDCDGQVDEAVTNACGGCGPVPQEVCNGVDDDCDGRTDESLTNACGGCGPVPRETCDGRDNNCDGQIDEGCVSCMDDRFEPNNTRTSASPLGVGTATGLQVCEGDDDFFRFSVPASSQVRLSISFSHAQGDLDMELLSGSGQRLSSSAGTGNTEELDFFHAASTVLYLRVYGFNGSDGAYTATLNITSAPACTPQTEVCDGTDNDCDGQVDEGCFTLHAGTVGGVGHVVNRSSTAFQGRTISISGGCPAGWRHYTWADTGAASGVVFFGCVLQANTVVNELPAGLVTRYGHSINTNSVSGCTAGDRYFWIGDFGSPGGEGFEGCEVASTRRAYRVPTGSVCGLMHSYGDVTRCQGHRAENSCPGGYHRLFLGDRNAPRNTGQSACIKN